jgi:diguanylate cyclase (GGDEF)-like protein/PAS domain S-box-containing protein
MTTTTGLLLVVDDNDANRDGLSRLLRKRGYDVDVAANGDEALAATASTAYDLVLLDIEMPGLSGLDVLTRLRATRSQTDLPVIMVTARSEGADVVEALRLGANDHIAKPIDFAVALARVATHVAHKRAVEKLHESEERYALAMLGANDGLWDWNLTTNQVYWSSRWKSMLGYADTEVSADPDEWFSRVHHDDLQGARDTLSAHLAGEKEHYEHEHRILHRDGSYRWVRCRGAAIRNDRRIATRVAGSLTDITESRVADPLTGLPNRLLFDELLDRAIKRAERRSDYLFALLVLGLDRFKAVNESLGRPAADRLLVAVARRLQASLRATDAISRGEGAFTLARIGGDEFTVLLEDITDGSDAMRIAERLRSALDKPFDIDGQLVFASAGVGIAISSSGYTRPDEILRDGTIALHRAKEADGISRCELFDPVMRHRAVSRLQMEMDLRGAIATKQFEVHYQPIVAIETGEVAAFEALLRWRHPLRGLLEPLEFITVAEETGIIVPIGRWILGQACRQMEEWQRRFGHAAPALMCVNVSSRQFADVHLADHVADALARTKLDPAHLKLEITESAFLKDLPAAQVMLHRVHAMGVRWSLDDFGTGYSSLSYLHMLPVETVKVDRAFVSGIACADSGSEMVRAIVTLSHNLGMDVVAEGVETAEQLVQLRQLGCEYAQGYYFSRPCDADIASLLIATQPWRPRQPLLTAPPMVAGNAEAGSPHARL